MKIYNKIFTSFTTKLVLWLTILVGLLSVFIFIYFPGLIRDLQFKAIEDKVVSITRTAAISISGAVYFKDQKAIIESILPILTEKNISFVVINNDKDSVIYSHNFNLATKYNYKISGNKKDISDSLLISTTPLSLFDSQIGDIYIGYSLDELNVQMKSERLKILIISFLVMIFAVILGLVTSKKLTKPLAAVVDTVNKISEGDLTIRAPISSEDEISVLAISFNEMVEKLITSQKKSEERSIRLQNEIKRSKTIANELELSESRLRSIFDNTSLGIYEIDIKGNFKLINDALKEIIGISRFKKKIEKTIYDNFRNEEEKKQFINLMRDTDTVIGFETEWNNIKGENVHIKISFNKIFDEDNHREHFVGTVEDITESKRARLELAQNEFKYRTLFNLSPIGILIEDLEGYILDVNPSFCEIRGYSREELIGRQINIISGVNDYEVVKGHLNRIKNGEILIHTVENKTREGETIYIQLFESLIQLADGSDGVLSLVHNITDRVLYEKELKDAKEKAVQSDKLKSEFLAQMSHEIRTPVNTILNFISLIKDELKNQMNENLGESFEIVEGGGNRLIRTIDLILDMSQLQAGTFEINKTDVNVKDDILLSLINEYRYKAEEKGLTLIFNDKISSDLVISTDTYIITQMIVNLLDNAIKYTEIGIIEVKLFRDKNEFICIEVKDTGIGMSKAFLENLFIPFNQEEQGYTRSYEGNGLGLSLVKKYSELIDAQIEVESEKGRGSSFVIKLH